MSTCLITGVTRGQLQGLQLKLSKWAAMAGLMCNSRQWWMYEAMLAQLSQQAAAGVRPELLKLMNVPDMTATNARYFLLHDHSFACPEGVVSAEALGAVCLALSDKSFCHLHAKGLFMKHMLW